MSALKVFMATHKIVPSPDDPNYIAVQAGAALHPAMGIQGDNTGDNISVKNPYYSELTVQYWIWKNATSDFVGLVHYRRHFATREHGVEHMGQKVASSEELLHQLMKSNFILVEPFDFYYPNTTIMQSVEQQYIACHGFEIFHAREVVDALEPRYLSAFDFVMRNNRLNPCNLFITRKEVFDSYSKWLFGVLFELERIVPLFSLDGYQSRVLAFLSERLFTVWLVRNRSHLHLDYRPMVFYQGV